MRIVLAACGLALVVLLAWIVLVPAPEPFPKPPAPGASSHEGDAGRCRIFGRTWSEDGPVSAAIVVRRRADGWDPLADPMPAEAPVARVTSDVEGRFTLRGLAPGTYDLSARAGDGSWGSGITLLKANGSGDRVLLSLSPRGPKHVLTGRAVGLDGGPLPACIAIAQRRDGFVDVQRWVRTDDQGRFRMEDLVPGPAEIELLVPGWLRLGAGTLRMPATGEHVVEAAKLVTPLTVEVKDASGAAIDGAEVTLWSKGSVECAAVTEAEGTCRLLGGEGRRIRVSASGYPTAGFMVPEGAELFTVRLRRGPELLARAVRDDTGEPVSGALIQVLVLDVRGVQSGGAKGETDDAGLARIAGVRPGDTVVVVAGGGWLSAGIEEGFVRCEVPDEGVVEAEIRVAPALSVTGVALSSEGEPVEGATVRCSGLALPQWSRVALMWNRHYEDTVATDAEGRFRLDGLLPGATYRLSASSPDHPDATNVVFTAGEEAPRIEFPPRRYVDVVVMERATGDPIPGAEVSCGDAWTRTERDGSARIGPLPPGKHALRANTRHHLPHEKVRVDTEEEMPPYLLELVRGQTIVGWVALPDGATIEDGSVATQSGSVAELGPDGAFVLTGLQPGRHELMAWAYDGERSYRLTAEVATGEDAVTLELLEVPETTPEKDSKVRVRVLGPDGRPVPSARATARKGDFVQSARVRWGEAELLPECRGGVLTVYLAQDAQELAFGAGALRVEIPAEPDDPWEVRLPAEKRIGGQVRDAEGVPVAGVRVTAQLADRYREFHGVARTLPDGTFEIGGLGELTYRLEFEPPPPYLKPVKMEAGAGVHGFKVTLGKGVRCVVTVLDSDGAPVPRAHVHVSRQEGTALRSAARGFTDAAGRLALATLPPEGDYRLMVNPPAGETLLVPVDVPWTPTESHTVTMERMWSLRGVVVDAEGSALGGVAVWAREVHPRARWTKTATGAAGQFAIERVQSAAILLAAGDSAAAKPHRGAGSRPTEPHDLEARATRVERGTEEVRLVLPRESCLVLEVPSCPKWIDRRDHPTLAAEGSTVLLTCIRRADGTFLFTGLVPGRTYDVWLRIPKRELLGYRTGLVAGERAALDLGNGVALTGRCTARGVTSYEDLELTLTIRGRRVRVDGKTDGSFEIPCLPPVEGKLEAEIFGSIPDDLHLVGSARVTPGREVEVRLKPVD